MTIFCPGLTRAHRAYNLQDTGLDTYDANIALGHGADERSYDEGILMLQVLAAPVVLELTILFALSIHRTSA